MKDVDLTKLPAFMLLRKSQQDQDEERRARAAGRVYDALDNQRQALMALADRLGVTVPPENIVAEIKSGKLLRNRKAFLVLLDRVRALKAPGALLLTVNVARITRGLLTERGEIQDLFIDKRVYIATMNGITNLQVADERLMYEFQGAMAHHYLLQYKEQVARTRAVHLENGRPRTGRVPFGYRWDKDLKEPQPHSENFAILQAICRDAFFLSIACLEEKYGVTEKRIRRALRSPMICGWPAQTTRRGENGVIELPREEWIWPQRQGTYQVAISREEWERLQIVIDGRQRGIPGGVARQTGHWCRDVVEFTAMPGKVMLGSYASGKKPYQTYVRRPERWGPYLYVSRDAVHQAVEGAIQPILQSRGFLALVRALGVRPDAPPDSAIEELQTDLSRLKEQLHNLLLKETDPTTHPRDIQDIRDTRKALRARADQVEAQLQRKQSQSPTITRAEAARLAEWAECIHKLPFAEGWAQIADIDKRPIVNLLVEAVRVDLIKPEKGKGYERQITVKLQPWLEGNV